MTKNETRFKIKPMIVKVHDEDAWYVTSDSSPDTMYKVTLHSCECKAFEYRGGYCKHMEKIMKMLAENVEAVLKGEDKGELIKLLEKSIELTKERKKAKLEYEP